MSPLSVDESPPWTSSVSRPPHARRDAEGRVPLAYCTRRVELRRALRQGRRVQAQDCTAAAAGSPRRTDAAFHSSLPGRAQRDAGGGWHQPVSTGRRSALFGGRGGGTAALVQSNVFHRDRRAAAPRAGGGVAAASHDTDSGAGVRHGRVICAPPRAAGVVSDAMRLRQAGARRGAAAQARLRCAARRVRSAAKGLARQGSQVEGDGAGALRDAAQMARDTAGAPHRHSRCVAARLLESKTRTPPSP